MDIIHSGYFLRSKTTARCITSFWLLLIISTVPNVSATTGLQAGGGYNMQRSYHRNTYVATVIHQLALYHALSNLDNRGQAGMGKTTT